MRIFFTADTHFYHSNIIKYCNRPFKDADEMNEELIFAWNQAVQPNDQIYHLGDFAFCPPEKAVQIVKRLHGKKFLLKGNHDRTKMLQALEPFFEWIKDVHLLNVQDKKGNQQIWLSHYCHLVWPQQGYGVWHLFAHSHGNCPVPFKAKAIDVGVDCWEYNPVSYEEIKLVMSQRDGLRGI